MYSAVVAPVAPAAWGSQYMRASLNLVHVASEDKIMLALERWQGDSWP